MHSDFVATKVNFPFDVWIKHVKKVHDTVYTGNGRTNKGSQEEFREYLIHLNTEYNIEDVFDKIEAAINVFDTLIEIAFKEKFPKYSMNDDLDKMYDVKDVNFLENNNKEQVKSANLEETVNDVKKESESVDLSQVNNDSYMDKVNIASSEIQHRTPVPNKEGVAGEVKKKKDEKEESDSTKQTSYISRKTC